MAHQPARQPDGHPPLTRNDLVVLAVLDEEPAHGFAVARHLAAGSDLGRILTVRRPQVYRAIERLVGAGLVEPRQVEPGDAGPTRTVHAITEPGRRAVEAWLAEPVDHVRDLRVDFLVKLRLLERRGQDAVTLVAAQRRTLGPTLELLSGGAGGDVVDRWRARNAAAAARFLADLDDTARSQRST